MGNSLYRTLNKLGKLLNSEDYYHGSSREMKSAMITVKSKDQFMLLVVPSFNVEMTFKHLACTVVNNIQGYANTPNIPAAKISTTAP
jgi:hypothetical protein